MDDMGGKICDAAGRIHSFWLRPGQIHPNSRRLCVWVGPLSCPKRKRVEFGQGDWVLMF